MNKLFVPLFVVFVLAFSSPLLGEGTCTAAKLTAEYATGCSGSILVAPGVFAPYSFLGTTVYSSGSAVTMTGKQNFGGTTFPASFSGTYTLNPDCTGKATINVPFSSVVVPAAVEFVVTEEGKGVQAMVVGTPPSTPVIVLMCHKRRTSK